jgi:protein O-mannosyl-transferase
VHPVTPPAGGAREPAVRLWGLLVFVVALAAFAQTVVYDFTFDDVGIIKNRELFHGVSRWREILVAPWWASALYRPFTALTIAANWSLGAGDPRVFHVTNVLLHATASVLVFLLARRLLAPAAAVGAGLLFAVHPVHVEAVANVVGRAEVLATLFAVAAVLAYLGDNRLAAEGDRGSWRRYATTFGTLGAMLLALASKESAFALPGLFLLGDWIVSRRRGTRLGDEVQRHALLWLGSVVLAVGWLVWRAAVVRDLTGTEVAPGLEGLGMGGRTTVMLPVVLHYVRLLFFPVKLSADYSPDFIRASGAPTPAGALGGALMLALLAVAVVAARRAPVVTFGFGWIAATVFIVANIIVPTGVLLAERTLYLPSVGAVLVLGWGLEAARARAPRAAFAAFAALLLAAALRTVTRNPVWRNNDVFFPMLVKDAPGSYRGEWTEAMLAVERGDSAEGERRLRRAILIEPLAAPVWRDLGRLLYRRGRHAQAATAFWTAWRLDPPGGTLDAQRAVQNYLLAGQIDSAEARLAEADSAVPGDPELMIAASDIALARGKPLRAMTLRRQAAWRFPNRPRYWALTAGAALRAGDCTEVARSLARVRALRPGYLDLPQLEAEARAGRCIP